MTIRLQLRDAVIARLNLSRPGDIPEATPRRAIEGEPIEEPEIGVYLGDEKVTQIGGRWGEYVERTQEIYVQHRSIAERNEELDDVIEPLLAWATRALCGARQDFGGLALDVTEVRTFRSPQRGDRFYQVATQLFAINYRTRRDDQTLQT